MQSGRPVATVTAFCFVRFSLSLLHKITHTHTFFMLSSPFITVIIITLSYPAHARAGKQKYSSLFFIMFDK